MSIVVTVSNRLKVVGASAELVKALKAACAHSNPDYSKKKAMGHWVGKTPSRVATWRVDDAGDLLLPRGATRRLRELAEEHGERLVFRDARVTMPAEWPRFVADPDDPSIGMRPYQERAEDACVAMEQGIVRAPTGSGKTHVALSAFSRIGQRTLVIVRDRQLLEQWVRKARKHLGMEPPQIGVVRGGRSRRVGSCLTLALQQTLWTRGFPLDDFARQFGAVAIDEVHGAAARTVQSTIDVFPARFRFGFSADETRKDRKEFLVYDLCGEVIYEVTRAEIERDGYTCPVIVRLVPTDFRADWYRNAPPEERDFGRLVEEMIADEQRGLLLRKVILELVAERHVPAFVFTHRREHAAGLSRDLLADGIACGLMMGGDDMSSTFAESRELLELGKLPIAVGTFNAIGQGIDVPGVRAGVVATPLGANRQFFGQVRGRVCRSSPGKTVGHLYYLWDREVLPRAPKNLIDWNDGRVEIFSRERGVWVEADERGEAA